MMMNSPLNWCAAGLAALAPIWLSGCAPAGNPGPPPAPSPDSGGYVSTNRSSWKAWHDVMPGPSPKTLHIEGTVTVSSANHQASLTRRPSTPETLHYEVQVTQTGGFGAQVLTTRKIDYREPYDGQHEHLTVHFPDGESIRLEITRAH